MKTFSALLFAATFVVATSSSAIRGSLSDEDHHPDRRLRIEASTCTLTKTCTTYDPDEDHPHGYSKDSWGCELSDEDAKLLGTDTLEVDEESPEVKAALATAISTQSTLTISEAIVDGDTERAMMHVPKNAHIEVNPIDRLDATNAKNANKMPKPPTTGTLKALVVRFTDNQNRSPASVSQLEDDVFKDSVSLSTQMKACSYGKLNIEPFTGKLPKGVRVNHGVVDVKLDYDITTTKEGDKDRAHKWAKEILGDIDDAMYGINLVLFCYPKGSKEGWAASGKVGGRYTDYNENFCGKSTALLHEVGHNLGLSHSGETQGGVWKEYGDGSGVMGAGGTDGDDDKMCYNPQKSFQLRWYDDKVKTIDPLDGVRQREFVLNGVADYKKNPNALVVLRLAQLSLELNDYYIGFNRAEGIHEKSQEDPGKVTVVLKKTNGPYSKGESEKVAALKPGEWTKIKNFDGRKDVLVAFTGLKNGDARIIVSDNMNDRPTLPTSHCKKFTVEVNSGCCYPEDTHWHVVDRDDWGRGVAYSPEISLKKHKYRKQICLPMGRQPKTYKFEIFDAKGDGIWGGNYKVFDGNREIVSVSSGKFKHKVHSIQVPRDPNPLPPTRAPTPYPTQSPTAAPPCQTHTIEFKTDRFPQDNKWKLYHVNGFSLNLEEEMSKFDNKETLSKTEVCLVPGQTYDLKVEDSHGDGICCKHGDGYYRVVDNCDKVLVDSGKKYEKFGYQIKRFTGSHCGVPNNPPTKAPTPGKPPTKAPTPGKPPTKAPTPGNPTSCKDKRKRKKFKIQNETEKKRCGEWAKLSKCNQIAKKGKPVWFFCKKSCGKC